MGREWKGKRKIIEERFEIEQFKTKRWERNGREIEEIIEERLEIEHSGRERREKK